MAKERKYSVWWSSNSEGGVLYYSVSDRFSDSTGSAEKDDAGRADVARFPVSALHDKHIQRKRAEMYADYMNKIAEATKAAYEQTLMVEVLSK